MDAVKRMIGNYEVICSQIIGINEIIIGENAKAVLNEKYLCCYVDRNQVFESYRDAIVGDNFAEMVKEFGERVVKSADIVLKEQEKEIAVIGEISEITEDVCGPVGYEENLVGKVIAIRSEVLRPEYQRATHQLMLCTGGFGSQPNARGRTCHCISLYDGTKTSYYRSDFFGTIEKDNLPEWAKSGLEKAKEIQNEDRIPPKNRGEVR